MASPNPEDNDHVTSTRPLIPEEWRFSEVVDKATVQAVERQTRGQRVNPDWFAWRQYRIEASSAYNISNSKFAKGKSKDGIPAETWVQKITAEGPGITALAKNWEIQKEVLAVQQYQELKSASLGRPVKVQECGLFIDPQRAWLAATPDGIVEDVKTGERLLCLEVKCPYIHREITVKEACHQDSDFCLELVNEGQTYQLKTNHKYYTQVQCQMAVTGIHKADLVVFTLRETVIVPVTFDLQYWDRTVAKLERFYRGTLRILQNSPPPDVVEGFANLKLK